MFYFLVLTGSGLILFGLYSRKRQQAEGDSSVRQTMTTMAEVSGNPGVEALTIRMDQIEKLVFQSLMVQEGRKGDVRSGRLGSGNLVPAGLEAEVRAVSGLSAPGGEVVPQAGEVPYAAPVEPKRSRRSAPEEGFTAMAPDAMEAIQPEEAQKRKPLPDNIRSILDYEKQGLSVQEIVNVTRMKKGEVLLLKNLSKHYTR